MNRAAASLILVASFALAATAFAQTTSLPSPDSSTATEHLSSGQTLILQPNLGASCPVGLRAQPGVGPGMIDVVTGHDTASQKLNLKFINPGGKGVITHARITVHGLTAQGRVLPVGAGNSDASTIAKDVDLVLTVAPGANASTGLLFQGFTSIRWIDLDSLTYADGSTWRSSPQHTCQITPDGMMLVASY